MSLKEKENYLQNKWKFFCGFPLRMCAQEADASLLVIWTQKNTIILEKTLENVAEKKVHFPLTDETQRPADVFPI